VADPAALATVVAPLLLLYAANFGLGTLAGRLLLPRATPSPVYGTVMRNLSIRPGHRHQRLRTPARPPRWSSPSYVIQVQAAAWYVRFTDKVFGPATPRPARSGRGGRPAVIHVSDDAATRMADYLGRTGPGHPGGGSPG
jgi:hypothetical protein